MEEYSDGSLYDGIMTEDGRRAKRKFLVGCLVILATRRGKTLMECLQNNSLKTCTDESMRALVLFLKFFFLVFIPFLLLGRKEEKK
jgi:hypothetical protein